MPNHLKSVTLCHTNEQTLILFNLNQIMNYEGFKFEGLHLVTVPETYSTMVSVAKCDDKNRQKEFIKGLWGHSRKPMLSQNVTVTTTKSLTLCMKPPISGYPTWVTVTRKSMIPLQCMTNMQPI